jgi:hypothetical protein
MVVAQHDQQGEFTSSKGLITLPSLTESHLMVAVTA